MFNRLGGLLASLAVFAIAGAAQADEIELDATRGAPVVQVQINGQPVRLIVDLAMPAVAAINPETAARLRLRRLPGFLQADMELDGERVLRGRIARPTIHFDRRHQASVITALFPAGIEEADGLIGPGALPYDVIRAKLSEAPSGGEARHITLENASYWSWTDTVGGVAARVSFDLTRREALLDRRIANELVERSALVPMGEIGRTLLRFGITTNTQAMTPKNPLFVTGFPIDDVRGHTDSVLYPPEQLEDEIVVSAERRAQRPPSVLLGRSSLEGCNAIVLDRQRRLLSAYCR